MRFLFGGVSWSFSWWYTCAVAQNQLGNTVLDNVITTTPVLPHPPILNFLTFITATQWAKFPLAKFFIQRHPKYMHKRKTYITFDQNGIKVLNWNESNAKWNIFKQTKKSCFFNNNNNSNNNCVFSSPCLQGVPGIHGKKGEMGRPVMFSPNIFRILSFNASENTNVLCWSVNYFMRHCQSNKCKK